MALRIKAFYQLGEQNEEIRRFSIDQEVATNFEYFQKKISHVFPILNGKKVKYFWKDQSGDSIVFSSDDELVEAYGQIQGDVFHVYIKDLNPEENCCSSTKQPDLLHDGVTCDGCEGDVRGVRFKCIVCADYDLCSGCEKKGLHLEHDMVRITRPFQTDGGNINSLLMGFMRNFVGDDTVYSSQEKTGQEPQCKGYTRHGTHHHHRRDRRNCQHHKRSDAFDEPRVPEHKEPESGESCWGDHEGKRHELPPHRLWRKYLRRMNRQMGSPASCGLGDEWQCKSARTDCGTNKTQNQNPSTDNTNEFLKNIGKSVAAMLDPFGIDVDIDVESPSGERTKCAQSEKRNPGACKKQQKSEASKNNNETTATSREKATTNIQNDGKSDENKSDDSTKNITKKVELINLNNETGEGQFQKESDKTTSEVNSENTIQNQPESEPSPGTSTETDWTMLDASKDNNEKKIYPKLPDKERVPHSNPAVEQSLQTMLAMGFNNDDDWLANLLASKDGDIVRVLNVIHPTPNTN